MLGPISAFLSSVTWALGASAYTELSKRYPAYTINFSRACVASLIFLILSLIFEGGPRFISSQFISSAIGSETAPAVMPYFWLGLSVIGSYGIGDIFFIAAAGQLGVPAALAIASAYPLWAAVFGYIFSNETLSVLGILGIITIMFGVILVILGGRGSQSVKIGQTGLPVKMLTAKTPHLQRGVLFAVITSLFWALNTFSLSKGGKYFAPFEANFYRMTFAILLCPLIGALIELKKNLKVSPFKTLIFEPKDNERAKLYLPFLSHLFFKLRFQRKDWVKSIPIFLLEGVGGSFFFLYGITHSQLAVGAALTSLAPIVSYPIALLLKKEAPNGKKFLGIVLVIIGIVFLTSYPK